MKECCYTCEYYGLNICYGDAANECDCGEDIRFAYVYERVCDNYKIKEELR